MRRSYTTINKLIADILDDLKNGYVPVAATQDQIQSRYSATDCWFAYREARRDYAYERGCLVICDEISGAFIFSFDNVSGGIEPDVASEYFCTAIRSLDRDIPRRMAMYRLPSGNYSHESQDYFMMHGEYLWTTNIPQPASSTTDAS